MKLVIDIDDKIYNTIKNSTFFIKGGRGSARIMEYNALKAIYDGKQLEQDQKWIFVSERLPASDEDVLVTNGRGMYIGWIDHTDKSWRVDSESEYFMNDIVAWMPLPAEPYKEEGA